MALTKIKTEGVTDDAITSGKIPANAVGSSEIADTAVTLAKLEHGTSSNDGKFLRANNGADPSFESLPASGATLSGSTDNTIVTVTGSNAMQGEANFTFDGTKAGITGNLNVGGQLTQTSHSASINKSDGNCIQIGNTSGTGAGSHDAQIVASDGTNFNNLKLGGHETKVFANVSGGTGYAETWRFDSSGNLACKLAGKGIDFSATSDATNKTGELFSDYEEGTWVPAEDTTYVSGTTTYHSRNGLYTKIGRMVYIQGRIHFNSISYSNTGQIFELTGLPFNAATAGGGTPGVVGATVWSQLEWVGASQSSYGTNNDVVLSPTVSGYNKIRFFTCSQDKYYLSELKNEAVDGNAAMFQFAFYYTT